MDKITYEDKVSTIVSPLPEINRITDGNMNEIKRVVNSNADALESTGKFSTAEQIVGTFLGKPLHRICIDIPPSYFAAGSQYEYETGGYQFSLSAFGVTDVFAIGCDSKIYVIVNTNPRTYRIFPTVSFSYPTEATASVTFSDVAITINAGTSIVANLRGAVKVYAIVEYTKTTE